MHGCEEVARILSKKKLNTTKLAILIYLGTVGESKLVDVAKALGTSKSVVWKHAKELKEEGLLGIKYTLGPHPQMVLRISEKGLNELLKYAEFLEAVVKCAKEAVEETK